MTRNLYIALGDSITAGHGATRPNSSFVYQVGMYLRKVSLAERVIQFARNGWTTRDTWNVSRSVPTTIWDQTNVLTVMTGGNDLRRLLRREVLPIPGPRLSRQLIDRTLVSFESDFRRLCRWIHGRGIPHVLVSTVYNPVPNSPLGVYAMEKLNQEIRSISAEYGFAVIDVYQRFRGREGTYIEGYKSGRFEDLAVLFNRPIHPNDRGHQQIATSIMEYFEKQATGKTRVPNTRTRSKKARNPVQKRKRDHLKDATPRNG